MISAIPYTANPFYGDFHWKEMNHKYAGMFVCLIGRLHKIEKSQVLGLLLAITIRVLTPMPGLEQIILHPGIVHIH